MDNDLSTTDLLSPRGRGEAGMFSVILAYRHSAGENLLTQVEGENWQQHSEDIYSVHFMLCSSKFMCFGILPSGPLEPSGKYTRLSSGAPLVVCDGVTGLG